MATDQNQSEADNRITLEVGGKAYSGWQSVNIKHSLEQIAGVFELGVSNEFWRIPVGERCTVKIGTDVVITGYVDVAAPSYTATSHEIKVVGRDATGDLVDCSAPVLEFKQQDFGELVEHICEPFGIGVVSQLDTGDVRIKQKKQAKGAAPKNKPAGFGKLPKQACNPGETCFRFIEKLARQEGVLLTSDNVGNVLITRAGLGGRCTTALVEGVNIKAASAEQNHTQLYSEIAVRGQGAATAGVHGVNDAVGKVTRAATSASPVSKVAAVARFRPLILSAETNSTSARCQERAQWEAAVRIAKSTKYNITIQGWREQDGDLWRVNRLVRVVSPMLYVDADLLIAGVEFSIDNAGGKQTKLALYPAEAFSLLKEIPPATGAGVRGVNSQIGQPKK